MPDLAYPVGIISAGPFVQGRTPERFVSARPVTRLASAVIDTRNIRPPSGTISDQVVLKVNSTTEQPFVNGRVWLLRLADGYKAWEGWSNATGHYTATGLELGVDYVAVAIDPTRNHKTTGAGPVTAVAAP